MSRSSDRERARLNAPNTSPSKNIASGLTTGHGEHIVIAYTDEEERIKRGILQEANTRSIESGLTYGSPSAAEDAQRQASIERGQAIVEQSNFDANELAMRREADLLEGATEALWNASGEGFANPEANVTAARFWEALTPEQRTSLVLSGSVDEHDADILHQVVVPEVMQATMQHNAEATRISATAQKALSLIRIREERGNPHDAAWFEHQQQVFAKAREKGVDLGAETLGSIQFDTEFRAAELALEEDVRAQARANFKVDVLNAPSTDITEGLRVLGPMGYMPVVEPAGIEVKPDYARAAQRGALDETADDIRAGVMAPHSASESAEWQAVQRQAGQLFEDVDASIRRKLGE
jgi:hypothetical protein